MGKEKNTSPTVATYYIKDLSAYLIPNTYYLIPITYYLIPDSYRHSYRSSRHGEILYDLIIPVHQIQHFQVE
ncbi:hypothetical protein GAC87_10295 [Bacteroides thetaiotaomicron]|uniref:Uncharacterized protein n=1 Tax=Bacteroides thetaiotaomicron TaxID=818 RepID=A0A6A2I1J3_BACT4|nr:hypothetical protein GAN91_05685 [Bacteroides thetaiotaomicron]KAB4494082.1 hypothetical protein GAN71_00750 [Bacteroides thetaiotaomicron]KAB4498567.1 hypothetical protein GAN60_07490 [Bacteroides thetaiotaomicron]KAB4503364.1 hypothetical protein GAN85_03860 [Bacteroides thetaiotaomicron]KAB4512487.1 hypothetical protein GAN72_03940 [Bacteroides thetaiotaomicron]